MKENTYIKVRKFKLMDPWKWKTHKTMGPFAYS